MSKWDDPAYAWYQYHKEDYENVRERLSYVRNIMLNGRMDAATDILEKSTIFAVLSIQTERDRHEDAYVAWDNGLRLDEAATQTVYGWQKAEWLEDRYTFDYEEAVSRLRNGGAKEARDFGSSQSEDRQSSAAKAARDYIANNFTGLSYTKASFALAMLGVWELICVDSNVKNVLGDEIDIPKRIRSASQYDEIQEKVLTAVDIDAEPFIVQWALYDLGREEHARHMAFYRSVLYE